MLTNTMISGSVTVTLNGNISKQIQGQGQETNSKQESIKTILL